jgi:histidine triad (HIT) family protein
MQDPNCIFCKIIAGEISARVVKQNEKATAFLDAFPLAAGHVLVVPKAHYQKVQDMAPADAQAVFQLVHEITGKVESVSGALASTVAIHNGREAGQEVPHVHVHIVPRKQGDGAGPIHSMFENRPKLSAQEMDALAEKMR